LVSVSESVASAIAITQRQVSLPWPRKLKMRRISFRLKPAGKETGLTGYYNSLMLRLLTQISFVKKKSTSPSAFFSLRALVGLIVFVCVVFLALVLSASSTVFGQTNGSTLRPAGKSAAGEFSSGHLSGGDTRLSPTSKESSFASMIEFTKQGMLRREVPVTIKRKSNEGAPTPATTAVPGGCPTTITHSLSQSIVAGNSTACFDDKTGFTRENTYWRAFDMNTFTGGQAYNISSISFGVEQASGTGLGQDLDVVLWTNNGEPFPAGTLEPLVIFFLTIINDSLFTVQIPLDQTTVPAGTLELVMEVSSPDGVANGNIFLIGSNSEGQTGPSYISEPDCGFPDPVDLASIGFPDMHMVFNVDGSCPGGTPTPTATPTPTSSPRVIPTPRPRPTPQPRPTAQP
jgi:hypothetical protein